MKKEIIYLVVGFVILLIFLNEIAIDKMEKGFVKKEGGRKKRVALAHDWLNLKEGPVPPNNDFLEPEIEANPTGSGNWEADTPIEDIEQFLRERMLMLENNNDSRTGVINFNGEYPEHIEETIYTD